MRIPKIKVGQLANKHFCSEISKLLLKRVPLPGDYIN